MMIVARARRFLACCLIVTLLCTPFESAAIAFSGSLPSPAMITQPPATIQELMKQLASDEEQATALTAHVGDVLGKAQDLFYQLVQQDFFPWFKEQLPKFMAGEVVDMFDIPLPVVKTTPLPANGKAVPKKKGLLVGQKNQGKDLTYAPPTLSSLVPAGADLVQELKTVWDALIPKATQLMAYEASIDATRTLLYERFAKLPDGQQMLDQGFMRFLQRNIHGSTRRIVGHRVKSALLDVAGLLSCGGGLIGSGAFREALLAGVDYTNLLRQAEAQTALHQQHACLDPLTSLEHEVAYVAAIELEESRLAEHGLSQWYPKVAAANLPTVLTLSDGKQMYGPTPFYNWVRLNAPVLLNTYFDDPGPLVFDRGANTMVKVEFCPGKGSYQVPPAPFVPQPPAPRGVANAPEPQQYSGAEQAARQTMWEMLRRHEPHDPFAGPLPYTKQVIDPSMGLLPVPIDPNLSYTPYGVPWSKTANFCSATNIFGVEAADISTCLQPQLFLERYSNPAAWGFGNCTLGEFIADGLRCRQPLMGCPPMELLKMMEKGMAKPAPTLPFMLGGKSQSLLQCLVQNVQPPTDPWISCAIKSTPSGGGAGGGFAAAGDMKSGGNTGTSGYGDTIFKGSSLPVYTPGSKSCGLNPVGEGEGGGGGTEGGSDTGDDTTGGDNPDDKDKPKKDDDAKVTVSADGKTATYDFSPQVIKGDGGGSGSGPTPGSGGPAPSGGPTPGPAPGPAPGPGAGSGAAGGGKGGMDGLPPERGNASGAGGTSAGTGTGNGNATGGRGSVGAGSSGARVAVKPPPAGSGTPVVTIDPGELHQLTPAEVQAMLLQDLGGIDTVKVEVTKIANKVRELVLKHPTFRKKLWELLNKSLAKIGRPPVPWETFDILLTTFINTSGFFGWNTIDYVGIGDTKKFGHADMYPNNPKDGDQVAWAATPPVAKGSLPTYYVSLGFLLPCLSNAKCHNNIADMLVHEFLHYFTDLLMKTGMFPMGLRAYSLKSDDVKGQDIRIDSYEHLWIYNGMRHLFKNVPKGFLKNGILQSAFDPKNFPSDPGGGGMPGTMQTVAGDLQIAIGPRVRDPNAPSGVRDRYPGAAGMCADDVACGGGCTVGQAQAAAFNSCMLSATAQSGTGIGGRVQLPGERQQQISMPTPDSDSGMVPVCADIPGGGGSGACVLAMCPPDTPQCCKDSGDGGGGGGGGGGGSGGSGGGSGGGAAAPWAIDWSKLSAFQNCLKMQCAEGQPCPCGDQLLQQKGSAAQPAPMKQQDTMPQEQGSQKGLPE